MLMRRGVVAAMWTLLGLLSVDLALERGGCCSSKIFCWLLAGPLMPLLTLFDLSDDLLWAIPYILIAPYWMALGLWSGRRFWRLAGHDPNPSGRLVVWRSFQRWGDPLVLAFVLALLALVFSAVTGNSVSGGPSCRNSIVNNLRMIDGAKAQFAADRRVPEGYRVTEDDLRPYFGRAPVPIEGRWGERYVLGSIGREPYAVLNSGYRVRRRGWTEGYTIHAGTIFRLQ